MTAIRAAQMEALGPRATAACQPAKLSTPPAINKTPPVSPRENGPPVVVVSRDKPGWLAIELVDETGKPVPGEPFSVALPDGEKVKGTLDARGSVRLEGIATGTCKVTFVERDEKGWQAASTSSSVSK